MLVSPRNKMRVFLFLISLILLQSLLFLFFCLLLLLLFTLEIICFYFSSFLTWKLRWLILDFYSFLLLLLFSHPVMSDSLRPHGLQHARPPVLHSLWELAQTPVHWVNNAIQPFHPLLVPSPAFNLSQHQGLEIQWVSFLYQVANIESSTSAISPSNSGLISFRIDWFDLLAVQGILKSLLQHQSLKEWILFYYMCPML